MNSAQSCFIFGAGPSLALASSSSSSSSFASTCVRPAVGIRRRTLRRTRTPISASLSSLDTVAPFTILAENELLYAYILKGSLGLIALSFAFTYIVGRIMRSNYDELEKRYEQDRDNIRNPEDYR